MSPKHVGASRRELIAPILILAGIALTLAVFSVLAVSGDTTSDTDKDLAALKKQVAALRYNDRVNTWQQCQAGQVAIGRFNTLMDALADEQEAIVEKGKGTGHPRTNQANRALIYRAAVSTLMDCGAKPRP